MEKAMIKEFAWFEASSTSRDQSERPRHEAAALKRTSLNTQQNTSCSSENHVFAIERKNGSKRCLEVWLIDLTWEARLCEANYLFLSITESSHFLHMDVILSKRPDWIYPGILASCIRKPGINVQAKILKQLNPLKGIHSEARQPLYPDWLLTFPLTMGTPWLSTADLKISAPWQTDETSLPAYHQKKFINILAECAASNSHTVQNLRPWHRDIEKTIFACSAESEVKTLLTRCLSK